MITGYVTVGFARVYYQFDGFTDMKKTYETHFNHTGLRRIGLMQGIDKLILF